MISPRSYVVVSGGRTYRRNRRQLRMVPQSDFHSVAKPADEPLQPVPQTDFPPVVEPVSEHVEVASPATVTMSGRIVKPPAFDDLDVVVFRNNIVARAWPNDYNIDPMQEWLPLNYSFVRIQNSPTNLVRDNKFFTIFVSKTRLVRLI